MTTSELELIIACWRRPYPGWSGRLGSLPGLVQQQVDLPDVRGPVTVRLRLTGPVPLAYLIRSVFPLLAPVAGALGPVSRCPVRVDAGTANPRTRRRYGPDLPHGELTVTADGRWHICARGRPLVAGLAGEPLDERQNATLAEIGWATVGPSEAARAQAWVLVQLAMTGLVLDGSGLRPHVASLLATELADIIGEPLPSSSDTVRLDWEIRSVRQRRAALRGHAAGLVTALPGDGRLPGVTALLVTRRPRSVASALAAVAAQSYPDLKIVLGLHGFELDRVPAVVGRCPVTVVPIPKGRNLGQALADATRAAGCGLVTKVDDDDLYGPEHIWDLVLARMYSGATVVGKPAQFVYLADRGLSVHRRIETELFTDTVAGGTILVDSGDLEAVGGWPAVPRHVDRALLDQVLGQAGLVYRTHGLGFVYVRHGGGHTWQADPDFFLRGRWRLWDGLPPYPEFGMHRSGEPVAA